MIILIFFIALLVLTQCEMASGFIWLIPFAPMILDVWLSYRLQQDFELNIKKPTYRGWRGL
jgi:hypothetical protein